MKKVDKALAQGYYKKRVKLLIVYLVIWGIVSYGSVSVAPFLNNYTFNGFPFGYFMAAQGAIVTFVILLFINAILSDKLDKRFGVSDITNLNTSTIQETEDKNF